ncbi:MAG: tetratricopeptide repeat protein [Chthonomonadaceae bacterium]|nr:tetratricopeptide repeat protein [Chthonomonadaceae bacterium]
MSTITLNDESFSSEIKKERKGIFASLSQLLLPLTIVGMMLSSGYLFIANRASGPPRVELSAFSYEGLLLAHLLLGLLAFLFTLQRTRAFITALKERRGATAFWGGLFGISLAICLLTGVLFLGIGFGWLSLNVRPALRLVHDISTAGLLVTGLPYLWLKAKHAKSREAVERKQLRSVTRMGLAFALPFVAMLAYTIYAPSTDRKIRNPLLPPMIPVDEGGGVNGKFFPASVQTEGDRFMPSEYYTDSKSCGVAGCHPDVTAQWDSSAHHRSSFNNQWYRKSIEYGQEVVGTKPTKWCGGCHDMAVLQTEDPKNPGKSRFDRPMKTQDFPAEENPNAHAGIGCAACHSIVHVKSTMGNSDFTADYPPMHKYLLSDNPAAKSVHNFLTRLAPEPHKKTFLRGFHKDETAKFCASCHKVHLDKPVNDYRWVRGQNEYDTWQGSGVSGQGAASFYYPMDEKTGQPAFKKCADCHMPKVASNDAANKDGFVKSHRFPGGNTAIASVYHDKAQLEATQKFLTDGAMSIDIFGIRRPKAGAKKPPAVKAIRPALNADAPVALNTNGNSSGAVVAQNSPFVEDTLTAPLNRGGIGAVLKRGENPLIDVVIRTKKLGHSFPGGTIDALDIWVELTAEDETGRVFYHSGNLQWKDGPTDEGAEKYRSVLVDAHGKRIDKRNVWAIRGVAYAKVIPPGAADVVHYRLKIPKDIGKRVTLTARLNYRKFDWFNNFFMYAGRTAAEPKPELASAIYKAGKSGNPYGSDAEVPLGIGKGKTEGLVGHGFDDREIFFDANLDTVSGLVKDVPILPITVLCEDKITLPVVGEKESLSSPVTPGDEKKDRIRWNDYGIGLLLQGDLRSATNAFTVATQLSPKWPEAYVNIGRVKQAERDTQAAQTALLKAFSLYDAKPTPMTKYQKARAQNFYAQSQFDSGELDAALTTLAQVREVFPDDRNIRNLTGIILFRLGKYEEACEHFKHSLEIEPEDISAHYNLMRCFRAKGDLKTAAVHEQLYKRFKADETSTRLSGMYRAAHPIDNKLAQPIHEIGDGVPRAKPQWLLEFEKRRAEKRLQSGIARNVAGKPERANVALEVRR